MSFVGPIDQGVAATGTINPKNTVEVGTQISGIIEGVLLITTTKSKLGLCCNCGFFDY